MVDRLNKQKKSESLSGEDILKSIESAYKKLIKEDGYLLEVDANERSITHRLAIHLESFFPGYDVDCEYNRDGIVPKRLPGFKEKVDTDDTNAVTVFPDIIIHRRGKRENIVVIEAKKLSNRDESDEEKLRLYKKVYLYEHAYFVKFPVSEDFKKFKCSSFEKYIEEM
jgi:hypothetical protein